MNVYDNTVSIAKCDSYDEFEYALKTALEVFGGIQSFINEGDVVAIKPNCVRGLKPEIGGTTHPETVRTVVNLIRKCGATPIIVESPGGPSTKAYVKSIFRTCGILAVAEQENVEIIYEQDVVECTVENSQVTKKVSVLKKLVEADKIISLSKPKPHGMQVYTGAVKNMFGAIIGTDKVRYHMEHPDYQNFANTVIDIYNCVKPTLNIMDAVVTMHKSGPTSGVPYKGNMLLVGTNAFAVDRVALKLIDVDVNDVYVMKTATEKGLVCADENLQVYRDGMQLGSLKQADLTNNVFDGYILPLSTEQRKSGFLIGFVNVISKFAKTKPVFSKKKCKKCGVCIKSCPAKCLEIKPGDKRLTIDLDKCIRCFCCEELCPETAVKIRRYF